MRLATTLTVLATISSAVAVQNAPIFVRDDPSSAVVSASAVSADADVSATAVPTDSASVSGSAAASASVSAPSGSMTHSKDAKDDKTTSHVASATSEKSGAAHSTAASSTDKPKSGARRLDVSLAAVLVAAAALL